MEIAAYTVFVISTLLVASVLFSAVKYLVIVKTHREDNKNLIRQPNLYRLISLGILLCYASMLAAIFWPEKFAGSIKETISGGMMLTMFILLFWWVGLMAFNWKVELFDDCFIHTNFIGVKHKYNYDEIEIRQYKACDRIFTDGKYRFTVSYLQENSDAINIARARYKHRLKQEAKQAEEPPTPQKGNE